MTGRLSTAASRHFFPGLCILICLLWVFSGLVGHEPWKPDEAYSFGLVYRTHLMITDVALLCGFSMSVYGLSLMRRRMFVAAFFLGTGVGLGFMTKGILAPGIIGSICLSLLIHPDYRKKQVILSYVLAALWSAPWLLIWPIALYMESDELFRLWFWDNNLARFLGGVIMA